MRILVTGGAGFLGTALVKSLIKDRKNDIQVFDSCTYGFPKFPKRVKPVIVGKLQNYYDIYRTLQRFVPEVIVHLAAFNTRPESIGELRRCAEVNYLGTANLLEACLMTKERPKSLIFSSSEAAENPIRNFGISKRAAEDLIVTTLEGMPGAGIVPKILRFTEIYGYSKPYSSNCLVNFLVDNMLAGNDIALYGAGQARDYVHISDAVRACELAIPYSRYLREDIASGNKIVTKDLIKKIKDLTNYGGELKFLNSDLVPVDNSAARTKTAKLVLNFECEADFDTELKALVTKRKKELK